MLQIVIWLGSVYLVFKGFETYVAARASPLIGEEKKRVVDLGQIALLLSVIVAIIFVALSNMQASAAPSLSGNSAPYTSSTP